MDVADELLLKCNCMKKKSSSKQTEFFYEEPSVICTIKVSLSLRSKLLSVRVPVKQIAKARIKK